MAPARTEHKKRRVNLALQGGGAHGAYAWGVLDRLLEDGRIEIEGIAATSAGTMNACALAYGMKLGGPDKAREMMEEFWHGISMAGRKYSPVKHFPWEKWMWSWNMDNSLTYAMFDMATRMFSPYEFNPMDFNPLRDVLDESIDFDALRCCDDIKLFISATNVRTGRVRIFETHEMSLDVAMASACLPFLYKAVEIDGEYYWDGGYIGNPALFPLFYHTKSNDIVVVHINPLEREEIPTSAPEIMNRINEISFNSSLLKEFRAIAFVQKLLGEEWIKDEHKNKLKHLNVHSIRADTAMRDLSVASKFNTSWDFLKHLRNKGRATADQWLEEHFDELGECSSVDIHNEFLGLSSRADEPMLKYDENGDDSQTG